jgi:hypothetical protein
VADLVASALGEGPQSEIRERLVALLGCFPDSGVDRGAYLRRLKTELPDRVMAGVAQALVSGYEVDLRFLARAFPAMRIGDVIRRTENLREYLRTRLPESAKLD